MWRSVFGVAAGLVAAMLVIMGMEMISNHLYPIPVSIDPTDYHQLARYMETIPSGALILVLAGWLSGSVLCGLVIGLITRHKIKSPSIIAGVLLMSTGIVNLFLYPHPTWFRIVSVLVFVPATISGHLIADSIHKSKTPSQSKKL